eukprot:scaffold111885_cov19-Tisochrysis_lutea.AAC.2
MLLNTLPGHQASRDNFAWHTPWLFWLLCSAHDDEETMQAKMAQMGSDGLPLRKTQNAGSKQTVAQLKVR